MISKGIVYFLKDDNGRYYIGSTDNLQKRIKQHDAGYTQTTRNMRNPKLVFFQEFGTLIEARRIERRLKRMKRKDYIEKIVNDGYIRVNNRSS